MGTKTKRPKAGRPRGGGFYRKGTPVYLAEDEKQIVEGAALIYKQNLSDFIRGAALTKAGAVLKENANDTNR